MSNGIERGAIRPTGVGGKVTVAVGKPRATFVETREFACEIVYVFPLCFVAVAVEIERPERKSCVDVVVACGAVCAGKERRTLVLHHVREDLAVLFPRIHRMEDVARARREPADGLDSRLARENADIRPL